MEAFRIISGILFLCGLLTTFLSPVISNTLYDKYDEFGVIGMGSTSWLLIIIDTLLYALIPGILSLLLRKPRFVNNLILTILFGFLLAGSVGMKIYSVYLALHLANPGEQLPLTILSLPVGLIFCFIMALVSLRNPVFLVGEPQPVYQEKFKTVSGILHLISATVLLVASLIVFCISLFGGKLTISSISATVAMISFFSLGLFVLAAGICSIRAAIGKRASDFSSLYVHLLIIWSLFNSAFNFFYSTIYDFISNSRRISFDVILPEVLAALAFALLIAWYLVCFIITLKGLRKKQNAGF